MCAMALTRRLAVRRALKPTFAAASEAGLHTRLRRVREVAARPGPNAACEPEDVPEEGHIRVSVPSVTVRRQKTMRSGKENVNEPIVRDNVHLGRPGWSLPPSQRIWRRTLPEQGRPLERGALIYEIHLGEIMDDRKAVDVQLRDAIKIVESAEQAEPSLNENRMMTHSCGCICERQPASSRARFCISLTLS